MRMTRAPAILLFTLLGTACQRSQPLPTSPSPTTPSPTFPTNGLTLSGVVYDSTTSGRRALAGVGIDVSPEYQSWSPQTTTDADGHYVVNVTHVDPADGTPGFGLKVSAVMAGYSQPCRAPVANATNGVLDIYLVSDEILSTTGVPSSMPILQPTMSGLVFEQTPEGARPIPGASLIGDFSGGFGWAPSAATRSDAMGRYMLCGVSAVGLGFDLWVGSPGYAPVETLVDVRQTRSFDVELKRQ